MSQDLRLLALSPHLDDAVLSYGAGLAQAARDGAEVIVNTVFAGTAPPPYSPAAERMHSIWGLSPDQDAPLHRRNEDIAALAHLGVGYRHGRFLDAIYRKLPDGRWLADNVEGRKKLAISRQTSQSDPDLFAAVKDDIEALVEEFDPALIVTCAAISHHVDNEITRDAALLVAAEKGVPVRLWEDLPHAVFGMGSAELPSGFRLGAPVAAPVEADARTRKFEALKLYSSQMLMLNGPQKDLFEQLDGHARKTSTDGAYRETTWPVVSGDDS
ncbi:PIG-L deacetylase family protein [Amycolatopsis keratiniphila]|uniref:PIG-L family deacetylase n=1 Tax=Amycolatopsis keratiniphila subsp. keratiniphila TaxID=227715 RepID=A0A1W2LY59_9PSEU|nr:PIG-L family deacetylase [Amycolatopsis keratiniphila]AYA22322.1 Ker2 [Amycolatopsis keratiniphila]OLZ50895.1 PIG-L family deacetylase [Amycolatopsis keratiniphila subsp. nogabecina]ONF72081.1 PIG-L family deacetylase [Amycolatopsis keratiniphila subsp. keratiniphila]SDU45045.1 N-acetylglucosaminyl deacetylase, LmbE family [Amycolatopsis keratiniphila]